MLGRDSGARMGESEERGFTGALGSRGGREREMGEGVRRNGERGGITEVGK